MICSEEGGKESKGKGKAAERGRESTHVVQKVHERSSGLHRFAQDIEEVVRGHDIVVEMSRDGKTAAPAGAKGGSVGLTCREK